MLQGKHCCGRINIVYRLRTPVTAGNLLRQTTGTVYIHQFRRTLDDGGGTGWQRCIFVRKVSTSITSTILRPGDQHATYQRMRCLLHWLLCLLHMMHRVLLLLLLRLVVMLLLLLLLMVVVVVVMLVMTSGGKIARIVVDRCRGAAQIIEILPMEPPILCISRR